MKWNKLPEKTPPFETDLVGWREKESCWLPVVLLEVREGPKGKDFLFENQISKNQLDDITHWTIPTKPKE